MKVVLVVLVVQHARWRGARTLHVLERRRGQRPGLLLRLEAPPDLHALERLGSRWGRRRLSVLMHQLEQLAAACAPLRRLGVIQRVVGRSWHGRLSMRVAAARPRRIKDSAVDDARKPWGGGGMFWSGSASLSPSSAVSAQGPCARLCRAAQIPPPRLPRLLR